MNGRSPHSGEVLHCLRRGNEIDQTGWSEVQITQVAHRLAEVQDSEVLNFSRRTLWGRVPLVSARFTKVLAQPLEFWTRKWGLVMLAFVGLVGPALLTFAVSNATSETHYWFPAFLLFFTGAVIHELGHAAALSGQGYPAGGIGAGVLFVIPVLHNDVSAVSMLSLGGKLRVDLAGVIVQAAYGSFLVLGALLWSSAAPSFLLAAKMTWLAVGWSLIPFIRADGYWALCDVLGLKDLSRPLDQPLARWRMSVLLVHRVLNIGFLFLVSVVLPLSWADRLGALVPYEWRVGVWMVFGCGILLVWWAMGNRVIRLCMALGADIRLVKRTD